MTLAIDPEDDDLLPGDRGDAIAFRNKLILRSQYQRKNKIVSIAGRKGSGKSTLTREILQHCDRLLAFDTMGEHTWIPDQHTDLAEAEIYILAAGASDQIFMGSYIPESDELENDFSTICSAVYEAGNMTLVVEELPMLAAPNFVPKRFDRIIRLGRHRCINVVYTGQRLSECPRRVTAATDVFILFSHTEPRDLDAIAERCDPQVAELVKQLDEHEFLVWDVNRREIVIVDSEWYDSVLKVDSDFTPAIGGKFGRREPLRLNDGE